MTEAGQALLEATPDACAVLEDPANGSLAVLGGNPALATRLDLAVADLDGVAPEVVYPSASLGQLRREVQSVLDGGLPRSVQLDRTPDVPLDLLIVPLNGRRVLACERIPSDPQGATLAVHRLEVLANIGSWVWQAHDDTLDLSDQLCRILGVRVGEVRSREAFLARVHAGDRPHVLAAIRRALSTGGSEEVWFRVVRDDGEIGEVCARGRFVRDDHGRVVRGTGTIQDFTERRQLERRENALEKAASEQLRALELNDDVIQRLARAWLALDLGLADDAREAIEEGIRRVHAIMGELFAATTRVQGGLRPGDLARRERPTEAGEGSA